MLMNKNDSILLIIDVQENLAPAQESPREVINGCASLLNVAKKTEYPLSDCRAGSQQVRPDHD